jgi:hypothetical protein
VRFPLYTAPGSSSRHSIFAACAAADSGVSREGYTRAQAQFRTCPGSKTAAKLPFEIYLNHVLPFLQIRTQILCIAFTFF